MSKNLPDTHEATRFIPLREVTRRYGRSRWWVRDEIQAGRFPLPVMLGDRPAFVEAEIEQHQRNLMARRESESDDMAVDSKNGRQLGRPRKPFPEIEREAG